MPMFRASVRYTFLDVEVVGQEGNEGLPINRRSRSDDFCCSSAQPAVASEQSMCHLDTILNSQCGQMPKLRMCDELPLKKASSLSSLSTMMPEDWDGQESCTDWENGKSTKGFHHCFVPKTTNLAEEFTKISQQAGPTTMMIRNVPNRYTQDELLDELESLGFEGTFDFFYAPIDVGTMGNVGYAFVNFVDAASAARCQQMVDGYAFEKHLKKQSARRRVATVSVAHLQGFEANVQHYEKSAVSRKARGRRSGPVIMATVSENA
jgi:hypothetical protein